MTGSSARRRPCADAGSASLLVLALTAVLLSAGMLLSTLGAIAVARHRAAGVADLGALSAAQRALSGAAHACAAAGRTVDAGGGRLLTCTVRGDVVEVVAEVRPPGPIGRLGAATARARAGPATTAGRPRG